MLVSVIFSTLAVLALAPAALGYPGMAKQLDEIMSRQTIDTGDSDEIIGDLLNLTDASLSPVGKDIKAILLGDTLSAESTEIYANVPALSSAQCVKDTCCVWKYIADDMAKVFRGSGGRCSKYARQAVRLGFHDAGGWSKQTASQGGGADGSILLSDELSLPENKGFDEIAQKMRSWYDTYHNKRGYTNITMADMIQMGATVAAVVCPLGPRIRSYVGRVDSAVANPRLLPSAFASADSLIQLFEDKTIKPHGLVALLGAHTTSQQFTTNVTRAGDPQDSTPGVWDVLFYNQTLKPASAPKRIFMFPSDLAISVHPKTNSEFVSFADQNNGQSHWNKDYSREYVRLSLLGVNKINSLTECTKVLPAKTSSFNPPILEQTNINIWLNSLSRSQLATDIANTLNDGLTLVTFAASTVANQLQS